jgi:hypothetical protein
MYNNSDKQKVIIANKNMGITDSYKNELAENKLP